MNASQTPNQSYLDILNRIRQDQVSFSTAQRQVAAYVLENYHQIPFLSISSLAENIGVSNNSIIKFCNHLGFAKFAEFKKVFSEHAHAELTNYSKPADNAPENDHFALGLEEDLAAVTATLNNSANRENLPKVLAMIKKAKHIYICGGRRSYPMAHFFATSLRLLGVTAHEVFSGQDDCWDRLRLVTKEDLVIAITMPRYSKEVVSAMKKLQERKVPTVLLTDTGLSPALPHADLAFYCSIPTSYYLPTCVGVHALINVICRGVSRQMDADLYKQYKDGTP